MGAIPDPARVLADFQPTRNFFVGIDSDGCAFDSMELKQKECFTPNTIRCWNLQAVSKYAREVAEFVNLYSRWRGGNRWPSLVKVFDLLAEREEVRSRGVPVPTGEKLKEFIASGHPLSDAGLREYMTRHPDPELDRGLEWSSAVNQSITEMVRGVPPFPYVRESLQVMQAQADLMVVSATPAEALAREWEEHRLSPFMSVIAGQEMGTKKQHLEMAAVGKYPADHILLIGDAPGDRDAAAAAGALYYPINPGQEELSWKRFYEESMGKFFNGTYAGQYQAALIAQFNQLLPDIPPWKK